MLLVLFVSGFNKGFYSKLLTLDDHCTFEARHITVYSVREGFELSSSPDKK